MTPCKEIGTCSYVNFWDIAFLYRQSHNINAFNAVLCFIKAFKYLEISKKLGQFTHTIALASKEMVSFLVILVVFLTGFAAAFHLGFGQELHQYKDLTQSFISLGLAMLGEFTFQDLMDVNVYLGPILFVLYVVIVFFVILSMFLAIVDNAYDSVREEVLALGDSYVDPLTKELAKILGQFSSTVCFPASICAKMFPGDPATKAARKRDEDLRDEYVDRAMQDRAMELRKAMALGSASLGGVGTDRSRAMHNLVRGKSLNRLTVGEFPEHTEEFLKGVLGAWGVGREMCVMRSLGGTCFPFSTNWLTSSRQPQPTCPLPQRAASGETRDEQHAQGFQRGRCDAEPEAQWFNEISAEEEARPKGL